MLLEGEKVGGAAVPVEGKEERGTEPQEAEGGEAGGAAVVWAEKEESNI